MNRILSFICFATLAVSAELLGEPTCKEGEVWKDDCNSCWCDNGHPACTQMACYPGNSVLTRTRRSTDQCVPLTAWKKGYVFCTCSLNGVETCEHLLNRDKRELTTIEDVLKHQVVSHKDCTEGTVWKTNCVECKCTDKGPNCAALPNCTPQPIVPPKTTCVGNERWKEDCNNCWCEKERPVCTRKACESHPHYEIVLPDQEQQKQHHVSKRDASQKCTPGKVWIQMTDNDEGCAKFTCKADGTVVSEPHFTREMCPSEPKYLQDHDEEHHISKRKAGCTPGKVWIQMTDNDEGCAKFTCKADGTVVSQPHFTREMCPSEPKYIRDLDNEHQVSKRDAGCKPGDKWMDDCNECTCNNDGKGSCTRKLCESDKPDEIPWL